MFLGQPILWLHEHIHTYLHMETHFYNLGPYCILLLYFCALILEPHLCLLTYHSHYCILLVLDYERCHLVLIYFFFFFIFSFVSHTLSQFPQIIVHTNTSGILTYPTHSAKSFICIIFVIISRNLRKSYLPLFLFYQLFMLSLERNFLTLK